MSNVFTAAMYLAAIAHEMPEQYEQDPERMALIAVAAEHVQTEQLESWRAHPKQLAGALVTALLYESRAARKVHSGEVLGPTGDICLMQIHPSNGTWRQYADSFRQLAGLSYEATVRCINTGVRTLVTSLNYCASRGYTGKRWAKAMWSKYAFGRKCWLYKQAPARAARTERVAWQEWRPTQEMHDLVEDVREALRTPLPIPRPADAGI